MSKNPHIPHDYELQLHIEVCKNPHCEVCKEEARRQLGEMIDIARKDSVDVKVKDWKIQVTMTNEEYIETLIERGYIVRDEASGVLEWLAAKRENEQQD